MLIKENKSTVNPVKRVAAQAELQTFKEKLKQFSTISPKRWKKKTQFMVHEASVVLADMISQDYQCDILCTVLAS